MSIVREAQAQHQTRQRQRGQKLADRAAAQPEKGDDRSQDEPPMRSACARPVPQAHPEQKAGGQAQKRHEA